MSPVVFLAPGFYPMLLEVCCFISQAWTPDSLSVQLNQRYWNGISLRNPDSLDPAYVQKALDYKLSSHTHVTNIKTAFNIYLANDKTMFAV